MVLKMVPMKTNEDPLLFSSLIHERNLFPCNVMTESIKVVLAQCVQEGDGEVMVANITSGIGKAPVRVTHLSRLH